MLYVAGSNLSGGSWRAYSLANPAFPQFVSAAPSGGYMHDSTSLVVTDARTAQCAPGHNPCEVLVDFNVEQVELWDVTNKLQPVLLGTATNPNNRYIHSGWPTANGSHVIFHDELEEIQLGLPTRIYTLDLANLRAPTRAGQLHGPDDDDGPQRLHARRRLLRLALPARRRRVRRREPECARRGRELRQLP